MRTFLPSFRLGLLACCVLPAALICAQEEDGGVDDVAPAVSTAGQGIEEAVIPQPLPGERYESSWQNNPFLKQVTVTENVKVSWEKDWALSSMFKSETGKIIIGLQNRQTGEYKRVSNEDGPEAEFRLVRANFHRNRNEATVEIARGNEPAVTIGYDESLTSKPVTVNNTFAPAAAGAPNQAMGQPVNVTQPGMVPGQPGAVPPAAMPGTGAAPVARPNVPTARGPQVTPQARTSGAPPPPSISRRRNLVPVPTPPPAQ